MWEVIKGFFSRRYNHVPRGDYEEDLLSNAPLPKCVVIGCWEDCWVTRENGSSFLQTRCKKHIDRPLIIKLCDHPTCEIELREGTFCQKHLSQQA